MEAVQTVEPKTIKNLNMEKPDRFARTLAVTQNALTKTQQDQIIENLTFLTALEKAVDKKARNKQLECDHFQEKEFDKRGTVAAISILPVTGIIDQFPVINNLAVKVSAISLAYAGVVYASSKLDVYIKNKETKEYKKDCRYIKQVARQHKKAIINSIR